MVIGTLVFVISSVLCGCVPRGDFAEANQWVFYGMAVALVLAFICSLFHLGTRVTGTPESAGAPKPTGPGESGESGDPVEPGAVRRARRTVAAAAARCRTPVARCFQVPNDTHLSAC